MLVRLFNPDQGSVLIKARGLRKASSKLAPQLQPAAELLLTFARGRGTSRTLTGVGIHRDHPAWRKDLNLIALYWYFAECAALSSSDPEMNAGIYQMLVNLLRSPPGDDDRQGCATVFCLKLAALNGLLPELNCCAVDGTPLSEDEPVFIMPGLEGLIGRNAYNRLYARTGGGIVRLEAKRRRRWIKLLGGALLDYPKAAADELDTAMAVHFTTRGIVDLAGRAVRSADFLKRQWKLPDYTELLHGKV